MLPFALGSALVRVHSSSFCVEQLKLIVRPTISVVRGVVAWARSNRPGKQSTALLNILRNHGKNFKKIKSKSISVNRAAALHD